MTRAETERGGLTGKVLLSLEVVFALKTLRTAIESSPVVRVKVTGGLSLFKGVFLLFLRGNRSLVYVGCFFFA